MSEDLHEGMVKVFFEPPDDPTEDWHTKVESMWALPLSVPEAPTGLVYQLENSPWYAFNVSYKDQVCAEARHEVFEKPEHFECGVLYFTRVWKRSGHSTYTLFLQGDTTIDSPIWLEAWAELGAMGCTYEGMTPKLIAVDVPPEASLDRVEEIFQRNEESDLSAYQTQHRFTAMEDSL